MATKIGPKTVTQRDRSKALVFCIDAANSDSYGGEPTTNVFPDPEPAGNFSISQSAGSAGTISYGSEDGIPHLVISNTTANSGTDYPRVNFNNLTSTVTDGFSISFEAKADDEGKVLKFALYSSGSTKTTQTANLTTEWKKFTFNNITTGFTLDDGYLRPNETYSGNKYIRRIQVEQKTSSTPFTATSRTASNAVKNISGVGALGTTLTGTFATYGQELFKPTNRRVLASFDAMKGHIGGAYWDLDGTDEYISVADTDSLTFTDFAVLFWANPDAFDNNDRVVCKGTTSNGDWMISGGTGGAVRVYAKDGNGNYKDTGTTFSALSTGDWNHVAVVVNRSANKIQFMLNGSGNFQEYSAGNTWDSNFDNSNELRIGLNAAGADEFNGQIACVAIWSSCLTAKEIKDIYIAQKGRFGK